MKFNAIPMLRSNRMLYWLVGHARYLQHQLRLVKARRMQAKYPMLPPPELRYRVHRSFDTASYEAVGRQVAGDIARVIGSHGMRLSQAKVLELGSGPGRVARWFKQLFPGCELHCSDIDPEAILWARERLGAVADFSVNSISPPTRYPDDSFDFIYCISVFTHLNVKMQDEWLLELQRILKPSGYMLATTHGRLATTSCRPEEVAALAGDGIVFRVERTGKQKLDGLPDYYQTTFHSKEYVERHWASFFDVVDYVEGGIGGHQDVVLLHKRQAEK